MVRIRALEKEAHKLLAMLLLPKSNYDKVTKEELKALIMMIPFIQEREFFWATNKNRYNALSLLIELHGHVNLNIEIIQSGKKTNLLNIAYEHRYFEIFKLLLRAGAFCNFKNEQGYTLLARSCVDGRTEEMVELLKAGAYQFAEIPQGYTPLGILTMTAGVKPDLDQVEAYLKNCSSFALDHMNGYYKCKGTPLLYACQNDWKDLVKLYLKYDANANLCRETDTLTALEICVYKDKVTIP